MYEQLDKYIGEMITYKNMCEICDIKYYSGGKSKHLFVLCIIHKI